MSDSLRVRLYMVACIYNVNGNFLLNNIIDVVFAITFLLKGFLILYATTIVFSQLNTQKCFVRYHLSESEN